MQYSVLHMLTVADSKRRGGVWGAEASPLLASELISVSRLFPHETHTVRPNT